MAAARAAGLTWKATCRLRLGVDEIATNAVEHGLADAECDGELYISATICDQTLTIVLEDCGKPYNPQQSPPRDDFELPLEQRQAGGLGIYLTLQGIDEFSYERSGGRNRINFIMKRK